MNDRPMKFVAEFRDLDDLCNISDEVERIFGFSCTICALGGGGRHTAGTLYVDRRFPTWERAYDYARELYLAACESHDAYLAAIR